MKNEWLNKAVFYEVYPSSFMDSDGDGIGDINGISQKLEYIKDLGCTAVWINPMFASAWKDGGYDVTNHKKVDKRLGTNEELFALFKKAHNLDMRVIIDLVPGHTSDKHPWFKSSCKPQKNKYTNRYIWTDSVYDQPEGFKTVNGTTGRDGNYIINYFSSQPALNYGFYKPEKPWQLPMEHPDCEATTEALIDVMEFWLSNGCDGFRVDMAGTLVKNDPEGKGNIQLWQKIFGLVRPKYPEAVFVSEWFIFSQSFAAGFDTDFYHTPLFTRDGMGGYKDSYIGGERPDNDVFLQEFKELYEMFAGSGYFLSMFSGNHDFVRLTSCAEPVEAAIAIAVMLTLPNVPFLYYGDEIGLKHNFNLYSKEGGYYRTGCRTPMQWNSGYKNFGFSTADAKKLFLPIDAALNPQCAESCKSDKNSIFAHIRNLLALRNKYTELQVGAPFELLYSALNKPAFLYRRGMFVIAANAKPQSTQIPFNGEYSPVYSIGESAVINNGQIEIPARSFSIFKI